jgi:hypothetical protein
MSEPVIDSPAREKPAMKSLPNLRGPSTNPDAGADAIAIFDAATAAYANDDDVEAARGFMRAAERFVEIAAPPMDGAFSSAASIAYDNAFWAYRVAARADERVRDEARAAFEKARAIDGTNGEQLAKWLSRLA